MTLEAQSQENFNLSHFPLHAFENNNSLNLPRPTIFSAWNLEMGCSLSEKEAALTKIHQRLTGPNMT